VHPQVGPLLWERETLELPAADEQQIVVFLPADDATAAAFDRLGTTAGNRLRAV
jgi:hypothetical protein